MWPWIRFQSAVSTFVYKLHRELFLFLWRRLHTQLWSPPLSRWEENPLINMLIELLPVFMPKWTLDVCVWFWLAAVRIKAVTCFRPVTTLIMMQYKEFNHLHCILRLHPFYLGMHKQWLSPMNVNGFGHLLSKMTNTCAWWVQKGFLGLYTVITCERAVVILDFLNNQKSLPKLPL